MFRPNILHTQGLKEKINFNRFFLQISYQIEFEGCSRRIKQKKQVIFFEKNF